ncbi:MAG TPA: GGDEF domain-containing protein [Longimicrobiales bacterium]
MADRALTLLSIIGLASQFAASVLLVTLYALLGGEARRRTYFRHWGRAWIVLMITLGLLVLHFELLPALDGGLGLGHIMRQGVFVIYQVGKLTWCMLLLVGTAQYARRLRTSRLLPVGVAVAVVYAVASALLSGTMGQAIVWQSPVATAVLGFCAWLMLRIPASRRTLGSRFTGWAFLANALLSAVYGLVFFAMARGPVPRSSFMSFLISGNSFLDQIVNIALGYGMVVVLLEDAKREVAAAHAELAAAHDALRREALFDALTGTLNRRAFNEGVGLEAARGTFGAVAMLDLDDLKAINDTRGHAGGDAVLRRLADVIRGGLRPSDKLYRWGGDEFLLIMPGASRLDLDRRVDALLAGAPDINVSFGAADYEGSEGLGRAIPLADYAMYEEKRRRKLPSTDEG